MWLHTVFPFSYAAKDKESLKDNALGIHKRNYTMSNNTLAAIRAKLQKMEDAKSGNSNRGGDGLTYAHWNINEGDTASIRFLPDSNPDNPFFWVEKQMIKLPFAGVKGGDESKEVVVQVPCMEMWGATCPVLTEVRPMFNDDSLETLARKYWKKRSYIYQGFVQDSPMKEDNEPENPIRKFTISPQIYNIIKSAIMDPDLEEMPTDYNKGVDFRITKTKKGNYADYSTSKYSRKESALSEEQLNAIEEHGLVDLATYLPKRPTEEEVAIIYDIFQASIDGELYDPVKWATHFKPWGLEYTGKTESKPAPQSAPKAEAPKAEAAASVTIDEEDAPFDADPVPEAKAAEPAKANVNDILAMVRNRQSS